MEVLGAFVVGFGILGFLLWAYSARPTWVEVNVGSTVSVSTRQGLTFRGQLIGFNRYQLQLAHHVLLTETGPGPELAGRLYIPREKVETIGVEDK